MLASAALLLLSSAPGLGTPPEARPTPANVCDVLEAAYTALLIAPALNDPGRLVHPNTLVPDDHPISPVHSWTAQYKARTSLTSSELDDLASRQPGAATSHYLPACAWRGAGKDNEKDGVRYATSFSQPIFGRRGRIALAQVSFHRGRFAFGSVCIVRQSKARWSAQCLPSWIT